MKDSTLKKFKEDMLRELGLQSEEEISFTVQFSRNANGTVDLSTVREEIKKRIPEDQNVREIKGIYKIYVNKKGQQEKDLFYIGMSKASAYKRLRRHFQKSDKSNNNVDAPERYQLFKQLTDEDNEITIKIIKVDDKEKLKYLLLLEEVLTLVEKPKYKDDLNNKIKANPDQQ